MQALRGRQGLTRQLAAVGGSEDLANPSLEKVAADCRCAVEVVEQLYRREIQSLQARATIQTFLPIVALRRVRDTLRARRRLEYACESKPKTHY
jgi:hypothetical protein